MAKEVLAGTPGPLDVVLAAARTHFYNIRLWDSQDVLQALLGTYERLPEALRAEIPIKRIWTMVLDE